MRRPVTTGRPVGSGGRALADVPDGAVQGRNTPMATRDDVRPSLSDPQTYYKDRCTASYKDGRKCINKVVGSTEVCIGHTRMSDATG